MFDLKKRNSLSLKGSREQEEFRRVAVRRRVKGAELDCPASQTVSGGVCGTYSCGQAYDSICASTPKEDNKASPAKRSTVTTQVPLKPAHLQSPPRAGQDPGVSPTAGNIPPRQHNDNQSPSRGFTLSVSCVGSPPNCSPSPARGGGSSGLNGVPGAHVTPARNAQVIPYIASSPVGSPSPGKRGIQSCSPLREGGHSPAKLSPRNHSPLTGKLRTPSPVQGRMGSYSPARNSKSWLGLHRIPSSKMERQEKTGKSRSVPNLIVYLDDSGIPSEKTERSPLKLLQSPNCHGPAGIVRAPANHRLNHHTNNGCPSSNGKAHSLEQINGTVQQTEWPAVTSDTVQQGKVSEGCGSKSSCQWDEAATGDGRIHKESIGEQSEEDKRKEGEGNEPIDEENTEQRLYKIAEELLHTERAYVARLHLIDQVFCWRLTEEAGRGSFPPDVIKNIFSNTSSIYSFHSQFLLPDLETCIRQWRERPGLGNVLLQHAPFLRMYADYVRNFDQAMELLRTWTERSPAFRNIIQDIQSQEACGSLTLQHHMLEPVQRLPRYEMLLRDYLRKLPEDNPDYDLAQKSLQTISMAATHSNSAIHKAESRKRLLEIYEMVGEEEVVNPTSELLREGRLLKLAARNTSAMERHLFLFNNFLLCCTPKFSLVGQRFTVRCRIGVDGMHVQQTTNEDHPYTFQVSGKEKTLELQASSEQDRDEWIQMIQEAIEVFQKKNETFKLASKELSVEEPAEELGRRAPRWIRDNEVTVCMECQEPFNALVRRRHHCRACGSVVCWKCSDNKVALKYDSNKLNKVCKACYSILTGQRGDKVEARMQESEASPMPADIVMSGFLLYGDYPNTWQRLWSVITGTEPLVLNLYAGPQDVKQLLSLPLPGCSVEDSCEELQGRPGFRLGRSQTTHTFSCDDLDLKQRWLSALNVAVTAPHASGSKCGITGRISDGIISSGEEWVVNGNQEIHS